MSESGQPARQPPRTEDLLEHAAWLRALAQSLVGDEHAAEDVVQETLTAAVEHPPREPGALRGWLARVARHAAWKSLRGARRRVAREAATARPEGQPSAAETAERIEMQRALLDAVAELEEPYRAVVVMRFYDGMAPREIARALGLSPEVVWQRLSRATAILRARLDRRYGRRDTWALVLAFPLGSRSATAATAATTATTTAPVATALVLGGAVVGTKMVIAAAVVVGALATWIAWPRSDPAPTNPAGDAAGESAAIPGRELATDHPVRQRARVAAENVPSSPAAPVVPRARIRGRVVDAIDGAPLAGAKVTVFRNSAGGGFRWSLESGADGVFAGEVEETASPVGIDLYVAASARGHLRRDFAPWTGPQGEDLGDVKLERGVVVRGRVETADGRPVASARMFATAGAHPLGYDFALQHARAMGRTDADGRFELDQGLAPVDDDGVYAVLAASADGVAFAIVNVRKGRDSIDDVVLTLRTAVVTVEVVDSAGHPVAGAEVLAQPRFGPFRGASPTADRTLLRTSQDAALAAVFTLTSDSGGRARFSGLPAPDGEPARYDIAATAAGLATGWAEGVLLPRAEDEAVRIVLTVAEEIVADGRIVGEHGDPVEGATVSVGSRGSRVSEGPASVTTDGDGAFVLERTQGEAGEYAAWVEVTKEGFAKRTLNLAFRAAARGEPVTIVLERRAAIEGTVVDQHGAPVAGVFVVLQRPDRGLNLRGQGKTGADGRFAFADATVGPWMLRAVPPSDGSLWVDPPDVAVVGAPRALLVRLERLTEASAEVVVDLVEADGSAVDALEAELRLDGARDTRTLRVDANPRVEHGRVVIDRIAAGDYALWIRVDARPVQLVRLHLDPDQPSVRRRHVVRHAVTLAGTVRSAEDGLPAGLHVRCVPVGRPRMPGGGPWNPREAYTGATAAPDGTFRIDGLTATAYELEVRDRGWIGQATLDASGGDASATIDVHRGAVLRVRGSGPVAAEVVYVETSSGGGPWTQLAQIGVRDDGTFSTEQTMEAGTLRWRAVFRRSLMSNDAADAAQPQEGEVRLEVGKDAEIAIPIVPGQ